MQARHINPALVEAAWPLIEAWVETAVRKAQSDQSPDQIKYDLMSGNMHLFVAWDGKEARGCWILEFASTHRGKLCNIYLCAGRDFKSWRHLMANIKAFARSKGCTLLQAAGRPGWERALARDNFKRLRVILETRLDDNAQRQH